MKRLSATVRILAGLGAGVAVGLALNAVRGPWPAAAVWIDRILINGVFDVVGRLFLGAIQMLVVPLVLVSLMCGVSGLGGPRRLGRVGGQVLALYLGTTAVAIGGALCLTLVVRPGSGRPPAEAANWVPPAAPPLTEILSGLVPQNPIEAMAQGNMLQIIVVSLLAGVALAVVGPRAAGLRGILEQINAVLLAMVDLVMKAAPIGVFALIARVLAAQGVSVAGRLLFYMATVVGALAVHVGVVYVGLLRGLARLSPRVFFRKLQPVMAVAFSTSSSNATLPLTLDTVEHAMGVARPVAAFALPLGATINMDGTAIMQGVATVFIAQVYGVHLGFRECLSVVLMATLASIGTAGVPGVGMVMLAMVLRQVGLPVEGIGLVLGVDRLLDMARTTVNVTGDAVVAVVVARAEGELDMERFLAPGRAPSG